MMNVCMGVEMTNCLTGEHSFFSTRSLKPSAGYQLRVWSNSKGHNHATESAAALRHLRVSEETKGKLLALFEHHHSPSTALETLKLQLQDEHGDAYPLVAADRSVVPDVGYAYRLVQIEL